MNIFETIIIIQLVLTVISMLLLVIECNYCKWATGTTGPIYIFFFLFLGMFSIVPVLGTILPIALGKDCIENILKERKKRRGVKC